MAKSADVICFGLPLVDIVAEVDDDFIKRHGLSAGGEFETDDHAVAMEMATKKDVIWNAGGSAANVARVSRWISQGEQKTTLVGCVADDAYGRLLEQKCEEVGVTPIFEKKAASKTSKTGRCSVGIIQTGRTCIARPFVAEDLSMEHFNSPEVQEALKEAKVVFISGFFWNAHPKIAAAVAKSCFDDNDKRCKVLVLSLSTRAIAAKFAKPPADAAEKADWERIWNACGVIIAAEREFKSAFQECLSTGVWKGATDDPEKIAMKFSTTNCWDLDKPRAIFMTAHDHPVIHGASNISDNTKTGFSKYAIKAKKVEEICDTNGCGDSFCGGVVASLAFQINNPITDQDDFPKPLNNFIVGDLNFSSGEACKIGDYCAQHILTQKGCSMQEGVAFGCNLDFRARNDKNK